MCGGTAILSFSHPVVHWAFKVGVAADIAARPSELFNHAPPSDDAEAGARDWTKKDARFNTSVPLLPLFEEFKSIGALILDHIAGGLCHELFVRVAPSSASVLATGGAMEGDLTGLASVNRCLYKFTHGHGYGGGAEWRDWTTERPCRRRRRAPGHCRLRPWRSQPVFDDDFLV